MGSWPRPDPGFPARRVAACGLLILALAACTRSAPPAEPRVPEPVAETAEDPAPAAAPAWLAAWLAGDGEALPIEGARLHDVASVRRFYRARDFAPAWTGAGCSAAMAGLAAAIDFAASHGLSPADYHRAALASPDACAEEREVLATDAWLALAAHLHAGRVDPLSVEPDWRAQRPAIDAVARLEAALRAGRVMQDLEALAPADPTYAALRLALARWRSLAAGPAWPAIGEGPTLREGDSGPRVARLRARLAVEGLAVDDRSEVFDAPLAEAVRAFQRGVDLDDDGVVGRLTQAELDHQPAWRVAQLRANLERWRWLPDDLDGRHIRVNIADFRLEARDGARIEQVHRVIVGREARRTPSFSADLRYLVLNPWWEVPRRLATQDKLPVFRRDPAQVDRLGFVVLDAWGRSVDHGGIDWAALSRDRFPYRLRQRPGPLNALGAVKLMMPNDHDVYLHDTPTRGLFARNRRDFSSGCIRVENTLDLAEWALAGVPDWDRARIDAAVASGVEKRVDLAAPIPVHLQYLTAVVDADGGLRFVADLYGRDEALVAALDAPPARRPSAALPSP
jgi:murein L,D-transpeptidase YcbB/YkuD